MLQKEKQYSSILDIKDYKNGVDYLASHKTSLVFPNPSVEHASIVLSAMFKYTNKRIDIYDKNLSGDVIYKDDTFLPNIISAIKRNVVINFYLKQNVIHQEINRIISNKQNVRKIIVDKVFSNRLKTKLGADSFFAISDEVAFRLEKNESQEDKRNAICSFNNIEISNKIREALFFAIGESN